MAALMDIRGQVLGERLKVISQIISMGRVTQKWGHSNLHLNVHTDHPIEGQCITKTEHVSKNQFHHEV